MGNRQSFRCAISFAVAFTMGCLASVLSADEFTVKKDDKGVTVMRDGRLLTRYLVRSGAKPILWPLIGPHGKEITRAYPMRDAGPDERADHVHHRSFWFTHGDVNGVDFWAETKNHGNIVHQKFLEVKGGQTAVIKTRNDWLDAAGKKVCSDLRTLTFGTWHDALYIDVDVILTASNGPVKFGDTKEGSFGVRVAGTMKVKSGKGGKVISSEGLTDLKAWGQQASWVDYHGPVDGKTVGIAILNHPSSFRYPTYWHVRDYGLFAANVFGLHHFKNDKTLDGSHTLKAGESFTLRHRVLVHEGDEKQGQVAKAFADYAKIKK